MTKRQNISSNAPWENSIGYSRAVKIGNFIEVAGTVASDEGQLVGKDDPYAQTCFILQKIEKALLEGGASLEDVVRTRIYITDLKHWPEIGKAHGEFFSKIKPASTMVVVTALISSDFLVEIEASAILS